MHEPSCGVRTFSAMGDSFFSSTRDKSTLRITGIARFIYMIRDKIISFWVTSGLSDAQT